MLYANSFLLIDNSILFYYLQNDDKAPKKAKSVRPYAHITTVAPLSILTDDLRLPASKIPGELYQYIRYHKF